MLDAERPGLIDPTADAIERLRASLEDAQDARRANRGHWMPAVLTLISVAMLAGTFAALVLFDIPEGSREVLMIVVGVIVGRYTQGHDYWLGSSRGSAEKQARIEGGR
jgi:hypothetical protein